MSSPSFSVATYRDKHKTLPFCVSVPVCTTAGQQLHIHRFNNEEERSAFLTTLETS